MPLNESDVAWCQLFSVLVVCFALLTFTFLGIFNRLASIVFEGMGDRHLFIGNLCRVTAEALRTYCEKYGSITDFSMNRDKENNIYHCFAFVAFQSTRSVLQFMQKRPHFINDSEVFVKRALARVSASIPERLVVTNRLVVPNCTKYDKKSLKIYLRKFGPIENFDYEKGLIDFDDYDVVDRILISRPHYIHEREVFMTKFVPAGPEDIKEQVDEVEEEEEEEEEEEDFKVKYQILEKEYDEYKIRTEREFLALKRELKECKEELFDVTQIKLDKLIKNQQLFHNQLLLRLYPDCDAIHAQMCEDFLRTTPKKKRKSGENE